MRIITSEAKRKQIATQGLTAIHILTIHPFHKCFFFAFSDWNVDKMSNHGRI